MTSKTKKFALLTAVLGALTIPALGAGAGHQASALVDTPWGPDRKTFTWSDPAPYATWNSITDNPQLGDERNFVRIREVDDGSLFGDEVTLEMGKTYEVYIYYHNNADGHEVGKTDIGIADGAAVKSSFPAIVKEGERATVSATVFASDTDPKEVWDGAYMMPTRNLYLRYVPGTATIHNGGDLDGQDIGPDYLFGDGALLGYNTFSGLIPGCNDYAGYITYQIFADGADFTMEKTVEDDLTDVEPGDEVTFRISYENTGTMDQENVVVQDTLSDELIYVPGSTVLYNNNHPDGKSVNDDLVTEHGMNIGNYAGSDGWAEVVYTARVDENASCGDSIYNSARISTTDGDRTDEVELTVMCVDPCLEDPDLPECEEDPCLDDPDLPECQEEEEETCVTNPDLPGCQRLPDTGPGEIAVALIIVVGLCGVGFYLYRSQKTLKTVEGTVMGGKRSVRGRAKTAQNDETHAKRAAKQRTRKKK